MAKRRRAHASVGPIQTHMQFSLSFTLGRLLRGVLLGGALLGGSLVGGLGCDTVPAPDRTLQPPTVAGLQVAPRRIVVADLPPDQVQDSSAVVPVLLDSVRARDPDGSVARVVFTVEPSSNPRGTISGELRAGRRPVYSDTLVLGLPLADEVYTVRVFAIDDDSLASNRVTGQFRVVAADTAGTAVGPSRSQ